jgi:hypothetical protein
MDDTSPSLDGPGGNSQADQRARRDVLASVGSGDDLAIRREHTGWGERLIQPERLLALANELVIHLVRAHNVLEFLDPEI